MHFYVHFIRGMRPSPWYAIHTHTLPWCVVRASVVMPSPGQLWQVVAGHTKPTSPMKLRRAGNVTRAGPPDWAAGESETPINESPILDGTSLRDGLWLRELTAVGPKTLDKHRTNTLMIRGRKFYVGMHLR